MSTLAKNLAPPRPALRGLPIYALIDPYLGDYPDHGFDLSQCGGFAQLDAIRSDVWKGRNVFHARSETPVVEVWRLPYLVELEETDDSLIDELTDAGIAEHRAALDGEQQAYRIGALIETWMTPADLMRRLQRMWTYRPNADSFRYLRIADRRVFEGLVQLVSPALLSRWLGPIVHWHFLGRSMTWMAATGDVEGDWYDGPGLGMRRTVASERALDGAALAVGPQEHRSLRDYEAVSRALADWQQAGRSIDGDVYQLAWAGAREAERHGLQDAQDKAAFAFRWMRDPDCADRTPVIDALRRSRNEDLSFAEAIAEMELEIDAQPSRRLGT